MSTITIDQKLYNDALNYARKHNVSIDSLVERFFKSLLGKSSSEADSTMTLSKPIRYKISPKVKALEMGYECPVDISLDYKQEILDGKLQKEQ